MRYFSEIDYAERSGENFLVICNQMSGFLQVYKCKNKSTSEALLKLREWGLCLVYHFSASQSQAQLPEMILLKNVLKLESGRNIVRCIIPVVSRLMRWVLET